jgi:hypothetical protein
MSAEQMSKAWGRIVARALQDVDFKRRLLADPAAVLKKQGVAIPPGVQVRVAEDTEAVRHLVLPARTGDGELSDEQLAAAAGGSFSIENPT